MRLLISCMECVKDLQKNGKLNSNIGSMFMQVELCDNDMYELTCPAGHKTTTMLQQQRFELLFEIGANAILDGYYREAVLSFTSSLERFYEFSIRVFSKKSSGSGELFKKCWKKVDNQTERQLGAFIFLWATNFNEVPNLLLDDQVKFRNAVIHKGKIPSKDKAIELGNIILGIVRPTMMKLKKMMPDEIDKVVSNHLSEIVSSSKKGVLIATESMPTILSLNVGDEAYHKKTLEQHLIGIDRWRKLEEEIKKGNVTIHHNKQTGE